MNFYRIILYFIIISFSTVNIKSQVHPNDIDFLFPLNITPVVSGSFAELRSNHFHSGIDISTNGKTGLPVMSMAEGKVSRIKISPVGYGNAIYIKHPNGYTTVYGHLERYAPKIDSIITQEQYKVKSFAIDYFPKYDIHIDRGEIIGYSGNSGSSGGPHLHYEIRDSETEEPINPFPFQTKIKDDIRPKILTIRLYPLTSESTINGRYQEKNFPVVFYDGKYHLKSNPQIIAYGKIGVGIEMMDYMSGSWKKCGIYKLQMQVNGQLYYGWEMDRFSFNESRYINSHIDYGYRKKHGVRFERCFRQPNNQLSVYNNIENNGIITIDETKNIELSAFDAAGNASKLDFKIFAGKNNTTHTQGPPVFESKKLSYGFEHQLQIENLNCYIPKGSLYDDIDLIIKSINNTNELPIYQIGDNTIPLQKHITIKAKIPNSLVPYKEKLALVTINGNGHHYYAGGDIVEDFIVLKTKNFGKFTFQVDSISPKIKPINFIKGKTYNRNSTLKFKITDDFSGIKSFNGHINGQWTLFEFDAKTNTLSCQLYKAPHFNSEVCNLKLEVEDHCNNITIFHTSFNIK